jgi:hypothetical protein
MVIFGICAIISRNRGGSSLNGVHCMRCIIVRVCGIGLPLPIHSNQLSMPRDPRGLLSLAPSRMDCCNVSTASPALRKLPVIFSHHQEDPQNPRSRQSAYLADPHCRRIRCPFLFGRGCFYFFTLRTSPSRIWPTADVTMERQEVPFMQLKR